MKREEITIAIRNIIVDQLGLEPDEIKEDSGFVEDLGADSLDVIELVMAVEEEFEIVIPDADAAKVKTVREIVDYVTKLVTRE